MENDNLFSYLVIQVLSAIRKMLIKYLGDWVYQGGFNP